MEWVESTGATIDEAKDRALDRLGVHGDDAEFEIITDAKTGLFGRIKEEARVRARVRPTTPRAKDDRRRSRNRAKGRGRGRGDGGNGGGQRGNGNRGAGGGRSRTGAGKGRGDGSKGNRGGNGGRARADGEEPRKNQGTGGRHDRSRSREEKPAATTTKDTTVTDDEPTMPLAEQADLAEDFVKGLAEKFGADVRFSREESDDEIRITVEGDDLGRMIGRRGATAGAIDELVRTVLQRQAGSARNGRVRVDVGGVRARRAAALAAFSREQAAAVRESGVSRALEPMGAADRKIIHDALTDEDGVTTVSEGEDPRRRVVIVPAGADD